MEMRQAVAALTALAQESRLLIFRLLVPEGTEGMAAGEIAEKLEIPAATLTFHLKELLHAGLIESRREGRSIRYSLKICGMRDLLTFLTEDCCKGRPELCGPSDCREVSAGPRKKSRRQQH
jgi:ArsR family transcriptional regulator